MACPRFYENDDVYIFIQEYEDYLCRKQEPKERAHVYFPYALKGQAQEWYKAIARHLRPGKDETKYDVVVRHLIQAFGWKDDDSDADFEEDENVCLDESTENGRDTDVEENKEMASGKEKEEVAVVNVIEEVVVQPEGKELCSQASRKRKFQENSIEQPLLKRSRLEVEVTVEAPPEEVELKEESAASTDVESHDELKEEVIEALPVTIELKEESAASTEVQVKAAEPAKVKEKVPPATEQANNQKGSCSTDEKLKNTSEPCRCKVSATKDKPCLNIRSPQSKSAGQQQELSHRGAAALLLERASMESPSKRKTSKAAFNRRPPRQRLKEARTLTELWKPTTEVQCNVSLKSR